jgi:hypothetical protein
MVGDFKSIYEERRTSVVAHEPPPPRHPHPSKQDKSGGCSGYVPIVDNQGRTAVELERYFVEPSLKSGRVPFP